MGKKRIKGKTAQSDESLDTLGMFSSEKSVTLMFVLTSQRS